MSVIKDYSSEQLLEVPLTPDYFLAANDLTIYV